MHRKFNVAVVGATGAVGETILQVLAQRKFPVANFFPLASSRSSEKTVEFARHTYDVLDLANFDFAGVDIAFFSAGSAVSEQYVPHATAAGAVVIDNTSYFRMQEDVPLVVPEVNSQRIADYSKSYIIANPNCSTIQMLVALKPLHDAFKITNINVATYQAVSGTGRAGINECISQLQELLNGRPITAKVYPQQIAFNVLPQIDVFLDNGYTKEEMKIVNETHKILEDYSIKVNPTAVRVPVLYGHSEAVHIKCANPISASAAVQLLKHAPSIKLVDDPKKQQYPTAISHGTGYDEVFVGRIRQDLDDPCGLNLWIVADNVRKGAATNAVQIAEELIKLLD
jgi:aspartate-semialdehyde dehydrogenase